jgi:hypothetical protein
MGACFGQSSGWQDIIIICLSLAQHHRHIDDHIHCLNLFRVDRKMRDPSFLGFGNRSLLSVFILIDLLPLLCSFQWQIVGCTLTEASLTGVRSTAMPVSSKTVHQRETRTYGLRSGFERPETYKSVIALALWSVTSYTYLSGVYSTPATDWTLWPAEVSNKI